MTGALYVPTAAAFLCACVILGGGTRSGFLSDVVLQTAAIPLLCWTLYRLPMTPRPKRAAMAWGLAALIIAVPLLHLLPLPVSVLPPLPARAVELDVLKTLAVDRGVLPVSVSTHVTALSALALLPPLTVFLSILGMHADDRRQMTLVFLGLGIASAFLGLVQLSQGPNSALRFYQVTNPDDAVGFFANRNHFAALLNCAIVMAIAWTLDVAATPRRGGRYKSWRTTALIAGPTVVIILIATSAMTRSRAGVGITAVAVAAGLALALRVRREQSGLSPARLMLGAVTFSVILATQYSLYRLVDRFAADPLKDARTTFARVTLEAIKAYFPFGSGLGTFTRVYPAFEKPEQALVDVYVNRAHNDLLEFLLEAGVFAVVILAIAGLVIVVRGWQAWTRQDPGSASIDATLIRAASVILALIALHSLFDYPLRTSAMMAVAALCFGLLFEAPPQPDPPIDRSGVAAKPRAKQEGATTTAAPSALNDPPSPGPTPVRKLWGEGIEWPEEWRGAPRSGKE